jgi:hypothetical protein
MLKSRGVAFEVIPVATKEWKKNKIAIYWSCVRGLCIKNPKTAEEKHLFFLQCLCANDAGGRYTHNFKFNNFCHLQHFRNPLI